MEFYMNGTEGLEINYSLDTENSVEVVVRDENGDWDVVGYLELDDLKDFVNTAIEARNED